MQRLRIDGDSSAGFEETGRSVQTCKRTAGRSTVQILSACSSRTLKIIEMQYQLENMEKCSLCFLQMGGPIWLGPLHDKSFVSKLLNDVSNSKLGTSKRLMGVLSVVHEELDTPLYYTLDRLVNTRLVRSNSQYSFVFVLRVCCIRRLKFDRCRSFAAKLHRWWFSDRHCSTPATKSRIPTPTKYPLKRMLRTRSYGIS